MAKTMSSRQKPRPEEWDREQLCNAKAMTKDKYLRPRKKAKVEDMVSRPRSKRSPNCWKLRPNQSQRPSPRLKFWPHDNFNMEDLTSLKNILLFTASDKSQQQQKLTTLTKRSYLSFIIAHADLCATEKHVLQHSQNKTAINT